MGLLSASFADASVAATISGGDRGVQVSVDGNADPLDGPRLDTGIDDPAWLAQQSVTQISGFVVFVGGVEVPLSTFSGTIQVTRSLDSLHTWSLSVHVQSPTEPFGDPFAAIGPPIGRRGVWIYGAYRTSSGGRALVPLIADGVVDSYTRTASRYGGYTDSYSGTDRLGRYDQRQVTLILPPGHGLKRSRIIELLALRAGETQLRLDEMANATKELQVVDGAWLPIAQEIAEVEHYRLSSAPDGYLETVRFGPLRENDGAVVSYSERDLLASLDVTISYRADIPTAATVTGSATGGLVDCSPRTDGSTIDTLQVWAPYYLPYVVVSGSFAATSPPSDPAMLRLVERLIAQVTYRCGVVVAERTERWAYRNLLAGRRYWDGSSSSWVLIDGHYSEDNDVDAWSQSWLYDSERWMPIEVTETRHYYAQGGFLGSYSPTDPEELRYFNFGPYVQSGGPVYTGSYAGLYLGSHTRSMAVAFPRRAVFQRTLNPAPPHEAWEDVDPIPGVVVTGSDGISYTSGGPSWTLMAPWLSGYATPGGLYVGERLIPWSETVRNVYADASGYIEREVEVVYGYGSGQVALGAYKYGDGHESTEEVESWRELSRRTVVYVETGEATHKVIDSISTFGGDVEVKETSGLAGARPAVERLPWSVVGDEYSTDIPDLSGVVSVAPRNESRTIKVRVEAPGLLGAHWPSEVQVSSEWAESEEELISLGELTIAEAAGAEVQFALLGAFGLREGQVVHLRYAPLGLDHDLRIQSVTHSGGGLEPPITTVIAKLYPEES